MGLTINMYLSMEFVFMLLQCVLFAAFVDQNYICSLRIHFQLCASAASPGPL